MNQILHCDWLLEHARWYHFARPGLPNMFHKKIVCGLFLYNKSLIDYLQAFLVKIASQWPCSLLHVYGPRSISTHTHTHKNNCQCPAILTLCLLKNPYSIMPSCKQYINSYKLPDRVPLLLPL